jgi:hypothetical protein
VGAFHPDATPGYGAGRISSKNIAVFMEKITGKTKTKRKETTEENCENLILH